MHVKTEFTGGFPNGKRYFMALITTDSPFSFKQLIFELALTEQPEKLNMRKISEYLFDYYPLMNINSYYKAPVFGSTDDGKYLYIFLDYHNVIEVEDSEGKSRKGNLFLCEMSRFKEDSEIEALLARDPNQLKKCQSTIQVIMDQNNDRARPDKEKVMQFPFSYFTPITSQFNKRTGTLAVTFLHTNYDPFDPGRVPPYLSGGQITQYFDFGPEFALSLMRDLEN